MLALFTALGESGIAGSFGRSFARAHIEYVGYVGYLYLFVALYPLYCLYQNHTITLARFEKLLGGMLVFVALLLVQSLALDGFGAGKIGEGVLVLLKPSVGLFGIWLFVFLQALLAIIILFETSLEELFGLLKTLSIQTFRILQNFSEMIAQTFSALSVPAPQQNKEPSTLTPVHAPTEKQEDIPHAPEEVLPTGAIVFTDREETEDKYASKVRLIKSTPEQQPPHISSSAEIAQNFASTPPISTPTPQHAPIEHPPLPLGTPPIIVRSLEENERLLNQLERGASERPKDFQLPSTAFLQAPSGEKIEIDEQEIDRKVEDLLNKLRMFKIDGDIERTYSGPIVTTFEFRPAPNVKVSRILTLEDDLAMALKAKTIRIQAPVPGKDVVGIEIPNAQIQTIYLREILESDIFRDSLSPLTLALGKDIVGRPFLTDLKKLPHLLIAGTTGSGKSVGINAMILSLLYKNSPDRLKMIMIDPKMLEFSIYNDIPHLLTPVITQAKKAVIALNNTVGEMERRYERMSQAKTKNIENYNEKALKEGFAPFPYIVVIIDELADLMMTSGKDVEFSIARLAQMARASGIHLIVATQRPSVDVVTGLIKANLPSRISYKVGQKIDSKVILDSFGAESLLGRGDLLFTPPGSSGLVRLHAPWSSEEEIEAIVDFLKNQRPAQYDKSFLCDDTEGFSGTGGGGIGDEDGDDLYHEAKRIILSDKKTSISYIQRRLSIGYNKAASIIEQMEQRGLLSAPNSKGNREILSD